MKKESAVAPLPRRRRLLFAAAAILLTCTAAVAAVLAVDVYLHGKYQSSAAVNVWGYRGPSVGRKRPGEYRVVFLGGSAAFGYGVSWDRAIPALLEQSARARSGRPLTVVNLAYNNEGAYSMRFTLQDYAYLEYDLACLYEGYNDLLGDGYPNLSVFRHDSPVFRLTGYLPIFPVIFREKAAAMMHGGDISSAYHDSEKTVFSASIAQRAAAGVLDATAAVGQSLERQLDRVTREPARFVSVDSSTGCHDPWKRYCRSMFDAVTFATSRGKQVLVITQPYAAGAGPRERHQDQQRELASMLGRAFDTSRARYVNLGEIVDLTDPDMSFDHMHLTERGNQRVAAALIEPVLAMADLQRSHH